MLNKQTLRCESPLERVDFFMPEIPINEKITYIKDDICVGMKNLLASEGDLEGLICGDGLQFKKI